jgi:F-type H+-transporting ATPase subunit delta
MKITPKQYAVALYEQISGQKAAQITKITDNFLEVLRANNDLSLAKIIVEELENYWDLRDDVLNAQVIVARTLEKPLFEDIKKYLSKLTSVKNIKLVQTIDGTILGGTIVKYQDKVLDLSLKTRLEEFKYNLMK